MVLPSTGKAYERRLRDYITKFGYVVCRSGGSGAGNSEYTPDLIAIRRDKVIIIEVKDHSSDKIYLEPRQVEGLKKLAELSGGIALVCNKRRCIEVDLLEKTGNTYKFDVRDAKPLDSFLR